MSTDDGRSAEKDAMGCWLCEHPVTGSSCAKCGCLAHYPPHQRVEVCVHCGDMVTNPPPGDWWTHARRAPDGALHTGKSRCQSLDVAYGHLAHPADVPCRADGPNPCLGATVSIGEETRIYRRDDGWEVVIRLSGDTVTHLSHLPMIVQAPPDPITLEYIERALRAHGYAPVIPAGKPGAGQGGEPS